MPKSQNIRVLCRVRPENTKEKLSGQHACLSCPSPTEIEITSIDLQVSASKFTFDQVFPSTSEQEQIFECAARPLLEEVFEGINCTLFCYGQTSSGKTFTMEGVSADASLKGIIPRAMSFIFAKIQTMSREIEFSVKCSYYQIYNEKIQDLLDTRKTDLQIREDKSKGIWVEDCTEIYVNSDKEMAEVFHCGTNNRTVSATEMNKGSSRSHSLFVVTIFQKNIVTDSSKSAKVFFVDLAGSEKMSKTGISGGVGLKEAQNINKSLMTLGMVINALTENSNHVPYRDSKLTRVLQESLGGNSQTTLIITCSPSNINASESLSTLRFGQRAKLIKNKVVANTVKSVKELMLRISELEAKLKKYENAKTNYHLTPAHGEDVLAKASACDKCEGYISNIMNLEVQLLTMQEELDEMKEEKKEMESTIKDKCEEIYELNEKNYLYETKDKVLIEDEMKLIEDLQLVMETFILLNQKKQTLVNNVNGLLHKCKDNIPDALYKSITANANEVMKVLGLDYQNCKDVLKRLASASAEDDEYDSNNSNSKGNNGNGNGNKQLAKRNNLISNIHYSFNNNYIINFPFTNNANTFLKGDLFHTAHYSHSAHTSPRADKLHHITPSDDTENTLSSTVAKLKQEITDLQRALADAKEEKDKLNLDKIQLEIIHHKQNESILSMTSTISKQKEELDELYTNMTNVTKAFEDYKAQTIEEFSKRELKTIELINKISDLEDEKYKLVHFSKDSLRKKYCALEQQLKSLSSSLQKATNENKLLKQTVNKQNEDINLLAIKNTQLQAKLITLLPSAVSQGNATVRIKHSRNGNSGNSNTTRCHNNETSFCTPVNSWNNNGKNYTVMSMGELLKNKVSNYDDENKRELGEVNSSYHSLFNAISGFDANDLVNKKMIKIIRGGGQNKEVGFFSKMMKDSKASACNEDAEETEGRIKYTKTNIFKKLEQIKQQHQHAAENQMKFLDESNDDLSIL